MQFLELKIENFLSVERAILSLDDRGVVLVSGENGAGKSSLTSKAIAWALFGATLKGLKGDSIVNISNPDRPCGVELTFQTGGKVHTVTRRRNPASIELDGQRHRVPAETQKAIEQLIGRDLDSFMAADYFGQDRPVDFLSMTVGAQMETMEAILRLSRLDQIVETAKEEAAEERQIVDENDRLVRSKRGQIDELDRQINNASIRHGHLVDQLELRESLRKDIDREENELRRTILKGPVAHAAVDKLELREQIRRLAELRQKNKEQASLYQARALHLRNDVNNYRATSRNIVDEVCPTCGGAVHKDLTESLRREQERLKAAYAEALKDQAKVNQWLASYSDNARDLETRSELLQRELHTVTTNMDRFENGLARLNKRREELKADDLRDQSAMSELDLLVDKMTEQRSDLELLVTLKEGISQRAMSRLSALNYWITAFGKIFKNMMLEQALPFLQERTEYHLGLLNNSELKVTFSTQKTLKSGEERQQFTVVAFREKGGQSEMALSGGERQVVSFAVGLALSELADSQTGSSSNLMILDEPFTMLDEANCEAIVHYVTTELVKRKATILLISNDERMKALIPGGIHVRRGEDGYSRVV